MAPASPLLELTGIAKSYDGHRVLTNVSLSLRRGEIIGLLGENGAGKSTLLNILSGVVTKDAGEIRRNGKPIVPRSYREANQRGIFRVFQDPALIGTLTVAQNLWFGWESLFRNAAGLLDRRAMEEAAREVLASGNLASVPVTKRVGDLPPGLRQSLDIARAVALADRLDIPDPVILFDEPTTALDQSHEENFLHLLDRLRGRAGVVFVSHRLGEVLRSCDRVVVLKDGDLVTDQPVQGLTEPDLHRLMVGRERGANYYLGDLQNGGLARAARLEVDGLRLASGVGPLGFSIRPGEVVGIAGTDGSGKRRVAQVLGGDLEPDEGEIRVNGRRIGAGSDAAVSAGIAFVPGDRQAEGLITGASLIANFQLPSLRDLFATRLGVWRQATARAAAERRFQALEVKAPEGIDSPVSALSGGNQQKVLLAKWLERAPQVLVLENPTQGVDSGAREAIYRTIREAAAAGIAVLIVSDDLPELIGLSDRILVMVEGRITRDIAAPPQAKPAEADIVADMIPAGLSPTAIPSVTPPAPLAALASVSGKLHV
ncbi:sugar ABC transporter ATP-binding protein [Rhodobacter sp. 24-YEA-8]|uniref:sugar ABC transporter ATP-binding protein n=1 Tax=Rhodobacter sp. 24-YEA-8 TaxID=1884310 RepID=UPI000895ADE5|nr:sugar ABC transporter ATP-binding protein [Rhodobacter sp. 24-YEA-8]SED70865.1 monosaccharide ABC transporter ATP-binding protein, CUT2 family [Rhodobacter sp. 24-YEA-8]